MVLLFATLNDLKDYTVRNAIILFGLLAGGTFSVLSKGLSGFLFFISGVTVPFLLLFLLYIFHVLGSGDIKLFCVIGGLFGSDFVLQVIKNAFFLGACLCVIHFIRYRNLGIRLQYLADYFSAVLKEKKIKSYYLASRDGTCAVIPFTLAITMGTILQLLEGYY